MNLEDLEALCDRQAAMGLDTLMLTKPMPRPPKGRMIRTPFGLAEVANWNQNLVPVVGPRRAPYVVFWIPIAKVRRFIRRARSH